jgi:hypothetical protein
VTATADLSFEVAPRRKKPITFRLGGETHVYKFTPPKQAGMVKVMINAGSDLEAAKSAFDWLDKGLSEEDRKRISDRLLDEEDDLDIDTVESVVSTLVEKVSGRPTT